MERYERVLIVAMVVYALAVLGIAAYLYLNDPSECSPDGYLLINGTPTYEGGLPVRCARLPL